MLRSKFVSQSSLLRTIPGERASKVARKMSPPRGGDISIWENWGHFNLGLTVDLWRGSRCVNRSRCDRWEHCARSWSDGRAGRRTCRSSSYHIYRDFEQLTNKQLIRVCDFIFFDDCFNRGVK